MKIGQCDVCSLLLDPRCLNSFIYEKKFTTICSILLNWKLYHPCVYYHVVNFCCSLFYDNFLSAFKLRNLVILNPDSVPGNVLEQSSWLVTTCFFFNHLEVPKQHIYERVLKYFNFCSASVSSLYLRTSIGDGN